MLELGTTFRKSRESQKLSIDKISIETKINSRFLEAIENERFDLLPGGIFNRGFIRTYAIRLGLNPDEAVQGYEKLIRTVEAEPVKQEPERVRGKTTKIPVYYVALVGLLFLVVVFYLSTRHKELPLVAATSAVVEPPAPLPPPPAPVETTTPVPVTSAAPVTVPTAALPAPPPSPPPAKAVPIPAQAPSASNAAVVIELQVQEESWFKLSSDGSDVVASEVLPAGTTRRYTAANSMNVSIGNAAGVALRVNGQPVSSLGRNGQVRNMTITPSTSAASLEVR
jgi:cytoskeleton protein RodZ